MPRRWKRLCLAVAHLAAATLVGVSTAQADAVRLAAEPSLGRHKTIFVGASLADAAGKINGVNCLHRHASTRVSEDAVPAKAKLVAAKLYISGSLLDDGIDYPGPPARAIFATSGASAARNPELVEQYAREAADRSVLFQPPGASEPIEVSAQDAVTPYTAVYEKVGQEDSAQEDGNVGFFVTPIDVTRALRDAGGPLSGTYTVGGLEADVCDGQEAVCDDAASPEVCPNDHSNGAASFGLLLIVEDPSLPLAAISVFEGMEVLSNSSRSLALTEGIAVSNPAAGTLAAYALEGDLAFGEPASSAPCAADEYIYVDGSAGQNNGVCLEDADNPRGNIFNSTINVQPRVGAPPTCHAPDCCQPDGTGQCPVVGVDIDAFDISAGLSPGATRIDVEVGSAFDQVALGVVVVAVDVFEPILDQDTQIRVVTAQQDRIRVGETVTVSLAVSNTGNTAARDVALVMDAPPRVEQFEVLQTPDDATVQWSTDGGRNGTGDLRVRSFDLAPGKIAEVRVAMRTPCSRLGQQLVPRAVISSASVPAFEVDATVSIGGPGVGECAGLALPNAPNARSRERVLRGGACHAAQRPGAPLWALCLMLAWRLACRWDRWGAYRSAIRDASRCRASDRT